jgi:hypothetical protein
MDQVVQHQAGRSSAFAPTPKADRSGQGEPIVIFIGSGEASVIERKVLIYSLHKHTERPLDIRVFNGTHNSLEHSGGIDAVPLPLPIKYRMGWTEFGLYRFISPQMGGHTGKAIYLDSDIVCLSDIGGLFDCPLDGADFLALPTQDATGEPLWRTSVMLMDCAEMRFDLPAIFAAIAEGQFSQDDFMRMSPRFLAWHPYQIRALEPAWNDLDHCDHHTKLIHYTDMYTQPWKHRGHPQAGLWFRYFREALAAGWVSEEDIGLSIRRGYARNALHHGFSLRRFLGRTRLGRVMKAWTAG